jgi:hypothetical protein
LNGKTAAVPPHNNEHLQTRGDKDETRTYRKEIFSGERRSGLLIAARFLWERGDFFNR